jgi:transposase
MMRSTPNKYPVVLTPEQRERLDQITRNGHAPARKIRHAQVLLMSDRRRPGGPLTRIEIAETLGMHVNTIDRIRKRFVLEGEAPALNRKKRQTPPTPPKLDGRAEAQLIAICCSDPPEGRVCWTLRLLADELVNRKIVTRICAETVRKTLKKTNSSPGGRSHGAFPNAIGRGSSRRWRTSSISTNRSTPTMSR